VRQEEEGDDDEEEVGGGRGGVEVKEKEEETFKKSNPLELITVCFETTDESSMVF